MNDRVKSKLIDAVMVTKLVTGEEVILLSMMTIPKQGMHIAFPYLLTFKEWRTPTGETVEVPVLDKYCPWSRDPSSIYISFSDIVLALDAKPYQAELYLEHLQRTEPEGYAKLLTVVEEQLRRADQAKSKKSAADYKTRH